jgi:CO/xanthine dehydrogenase FAD-binding subunit
MSEIQWYFPKTLEEASELLLRDGNFLHGGGTGLLRGSMNRVRGLIDLSNLSLSYFHVKKDIIEIGATCTFTETAENLLRADPQNALGSSLASAASTPLRNRITIGGSVASFPAWSDPMGPLIALDAEVSLTGAQKGNFKITRYATDTNLRKNTLITGVSFQRERWSSYYHRETVTHFDYPAFTVTILIEKEGNLLTDARVVIVGSVGKFKRLTGIEDDLRGKAVDTVQSDEIVAHLDVDFNGKKSFSPDYLKHLAAAQLERGLIHLIGS